MNNKTAIKASMFLVAVSTNSLVEAACNYGWYNPGSGCVIAPLGTYANDPNATAPTPASPGYYVDQTGQTSSLRAQAGTYVPSSGASVALQAPAGSYVPDSGASSYILAPAGTFVPNMGSTAPQPVPIGKYLPTTGNVDASAALAPSPGYYVAAAGAANQMPAGGVAAPLTSALQSSDLLTGLALDVIQSNQPDGLKVAVAYQRSDVNQLGVAAGKLNSNIGGITVGVDRQTESFGKVGIVGGYSYNGMSAGGEVNNTSNAFQLGIFNSGTIFDANYVGMVVYGSASNKLQRNLTDSYFSGTAITANESLSSNSNVSWYGVQGKVALPLTNIAKPLSAFAQLGVLGYRAGAFNETGTATSGGGTPISALAGLNVAGLNYTAIPFVLGASYDLMEKQSGKANAPLTFSVGVLGNLSAKQNLVASTQNQTIYSFDLPVAQTSYVSGLVKLKVNEMDVGSGFKLAGVLQAVIGGAYNSYQGNLQLLKSF